ncbi:dephospho-CoA kinase [Candidatus Poribacteria bacterium]|nr:dephospho-CoA kinase [Candidatus Poribacteria bacterium]
MLIVGLTGNIACGKTTAAVYLKKLGAYVIEADKISHKFMQPGTQQYSEILKYFGDGILDDEKNINRRKLGCIVFADKEKLKVLNKILHPPTIEFIKKDISKNHTESVIVIESALILETELKNLIDKLIVVRTPKHMQLVRFKNKQMTVNEGKERLKAQISLSTKIKQADFVINNNRDFKYLYQQIDKIWKKLEVT